MGPVLRVRLLAPTGKGQTSTMSGLVYQLALAGGSLGAVALFVRRWPPARRWGPALGMASAAVAYVAARTPGEEKWALGVLIVDAALVLYVVILRLVRSWSSDRDR